MGQSIGVAYDLSVADYRAIKALLATARPKRPPALARRDEDDQPVFYITIAFMFRWIDSCWVHECSRVKSSGSGRPIHLAIFLASA